MFAIQRVVLNTNQNPAKNGGQVTEMMHKKCENKRKNTLYALPNRR